MTATDELRRMLDERGVEWWEGWDKDLTLFDGADGIRWIADYMLGELFLRSVLSITPEQAIAATLGPREQPPYDLLIDLLRDEWDIEASWDGLRRFWYVGLTDEGVRKRDEREATLGRGTCPFCGGGAE